MVYQIQIREEGVPKTSFCAHEGLYEFQVMSFRLSNAPTTFQVVMNDLFLPYLRKFVLVFFDDIIIYSKNWNSHLKHVETILKLLEENKFYANKSKCSFRQKEIEFWGHVVSVDDNKVNPKSIMAIKNWSSPNSITSLRGFMGLIDYYRRFVHN